MFAVWMCLRVAHLLAGGYLMYHGFQLWSVHSPCVDDDAWGHRGRHTDEIPHFDISGQHQQQTYAKLHL